MPQAGDIVTAPIFWARVGEHLTGRVREIDAPIQGDAISRNLYQLPNPPGQLWERIAEGATR